MTIVHRDIVYFIARQARAHKNSGETPADLQSIPALPELQQLLASTHCIQIRVYLAREHPRELLQLWLLTLQKMSTMTRPGRRRSRSFPGKLDTSISPQSIQRPLTRHYRKSASEFYDPCQEFADRSLKCMKRNAFDREMCHDYFQYADLVFMLGSLSWAPRRISPLCHCTNDPNL